MLPKDFKGHQIKRYQRLSKTFKAINGHQSSERLPKAIRGYQKSSRLPTGNSKLFKAILCSTNPYYLL